MSDEHSTRVDAFIRREVQSELDAIHPRFQTEDPEAVRQYQIENHYYCELCDQFFAPTVVALKLHFKGDMVQHRPIGTCFYCKGNVFEYKKNNVQQLYHICREVKND